MMLRRTTGTIVLALLALFCSGCPALMVGGLAYQGYKYEHDKNQPQESEHSKKSSSEAPEKVPDAAVE